MLHWAEENKIRTKRNGNYEIPQRNGIDWKFDFKFVTKLDSMLADGLDNKLKKKEMEMCNELYEFYKGNAKHPDGRYFKNIKNSS